MVREALKKQLARLREFKQEHPWAKVLINQYLIIVVVFGSLFFFVGNSNVLTWIRDRHTIEAQNKQIEEYRRQIAATDSALYHIQHSKDTIEKYAREHFYYHEDDEEIFVVR
ncbi:MAG: septum formation initiator family protein [Bacteroidales bacterium]|nr:septum formation initiator family protein [Bacteroidales bacterium]